MSHSFIRCLWGNVNDHTNRYTLRRTKIINDIKFVLSNPHEPTFVCYTFGKENHKLLTDLGVDSRMIDERPMVWDYNTQMYRHKLECFRLALLDFDEIVFLDWDVGIIKELPSDYWTKMRAKSSFSAILRIYHCRKCMWRRDELRKAPCASYVYMRENVANEVIQCWEELKKPWSEETAMALWCDKQMEIFSVDEYNRRYEPDDFELIEGGLAKKDPKKIVFKHYREKQIAWLLARRKI